MFFTNATDAALLISCGDVKFISNVASAVLLRCANIKRKNISKRYFYIYYRALT